MSWKGDDINLLWTWIIIFILAVIIEALTVSFASLMVGLGAVVAFIFGLLGFSTMAQIFAFIISSIILLLILKPFSNKFIVKEVEKTNIDAVIGEKGIVTKRISNKEQVGEVKLKGLYYTARSIDDEIIIEEGTEVVANRIEGVRLFVEPLTSTKSKHNESKEGISS